MDMRTKVYLIVLSIAISSLVPQPVMAQDIVDDAVKVVGGLINVIGKKKKAKQKVQQEQQTATKKNDSKVTNGAQDVEQREQTPPLDIFKTMLLPPSEGLDLVIIDKEKVNVRKTPNGPIRNKFGEDIFYEGWRMTSGKIYPSGWLYALEGSASGFISPKVFHKAKLDPFQPWMFNKVEAYKKKSNGEERTWRLGINKESGLVLKIGNERDTEIFDKHLSIGRIENNLFYSFSSVTIDLNYDANALIVRVNKLTHPKMGDGQYYYQIVYGPTCVVETNRGARLDLEKLPSKILEQLFLPVDDYIYSIPNISSDISQLSYGYGDGDPYLSSCINAELLSPPYVDYTPQGESVSSVSQPKSSGQLYLMGIPVKQPKANLDAQLKSKGFVQKKDEYGNVELFGLVDGVSVRIFTADKCLTVTDKKLYSFANAKKRFSALFTKITSEYGKGKYTSEGEDIRTYQIDGPGGTIEISMWDSDEVNFTSGQYLVSVTYNAIYVK